MSNKWLVMNTVYMEDDWAMSEVMVLELTPKVQEDLLAVLDIVGVDHPSFGMPCPLTYFTPSLTPLFYETGTQGEEESVWVTECNPFEGMEDQGYRAVSVSRLHDNLFFQASEKYGSDREYGVFGKAEIMGEALTPADAVRQILGESESEEESA